MNSVPKSLISKDVRIKPFLRWAGSKRQLVTTLAHNIDRPFSRYVEPFVGSACLFFYLQPKKALLGDINEELIQTYKQIKYRYNEVFDQISRFSYGKEEYERLRKISLQAMMGPERAARFVYLNRFCFNGLYRTNLKGEFNVPFGGHKSGALPTREHLKLCSTTLKRANLISGDFELILSQVREGDFVYLDPPYVTSSERTFREYSKNVFSLSDLLRVRKWLELFQSNNIPFMVSYADCEEADILCTDFKWYKINVLRRIAGSTFHRKYAYERIIINT